MTTTPSTRRRYRDLRIGPDGLISTHLICTRCQYDLHGLPYDFLCPECGRPIVDTLRTDHIGARYTRYYGVPIQTIGRVQQHVPCINCRHDLRGAEATGHCPECGHDVPDALDGRRIIFAPPHYRDEVQAGADLMLFALAVDFCLFAGAVGANAAGAYAIGQALLALALLALLASAFFLPVGWYMLSSADQTCAEDWGLSTARSRSRDGLKIVLIGPLSVLIAFIVTDVSSSEIGELAAVTLFTVGTVIALFGAAIHLDQAMIYLDLMADRIAHPPGHRFATARRWLIVGTLVAVAAYPGMEAMAMRIGLSAHVAVGVRLAVSLGTLFVALAYVLAVTRIAIALHREPRRDSAVAARMRDHPSLCGEDV